ncbi:hypothetical protein PAECIP112173_04654 [Paenibacillus sp. JJ-100]|uniref:S-layer homology domain-containing protein n=1 Tax=Paenibacillus sp. JJ-100 TaxID=2974896 RepID=UPI0022FF552F|nr:S-layer homology domain-containing protein [Paenibacillus sp. JJ-100]CAI6085478.1 hypothetical protein PAECIP112173_04654 [Paenibacillus sp. JJ-100]
MLKFRFKTFLNALMVTLVMLLMVIPTSFASVESAGAGFKDVSRDHWAYGSIQDGYNKGIVTGYLDGTFKPDKPVNQAEFITMLVRAYPEQIVIVGLEDIWYKLYYQVADTLGWDYRDGDPSNFKFTRGDTARLISSVLFEKKSEQEAVEALILEGVAKGVTSQTYEGFQPDKTLTRAEALTFVKRVQDYVDTHYSSDLLSITNHSTIYVYSLNAPIEIEYLIGTDYKPIYGKYDPVRGFELDSYVIPQKAIDHYIKLKELQGEQEPEDLPTDNLIKGVLGNVAFRGVKLGDSEGTLKSLLGKPNRVDPDFLGHEWYVYNSDYSKYVKFAVRDNKVVGAYTNSKGVMTTEYNLEIGMSKSEAELSVGREISLTSYEEFSDGDYIKISLDKNDQGQPIESVYILKGIESIGWELTKEQRKIANSEEYLLSQAKSILDITNAFRVKHGKTVLRWSDNAYRSAQAHSVDMSENVYVSHDSLDGRTAFDRMTAAGVKYTTAGENIAAGYLNDTDAMTGWINSSTGHRETMLHDFSFLGVGVYDYYYTQNFYR